MENSEETFQVIDYGNDYFLTSRKIWNYSLDSNEYHLYGAISSHANYTRKDAWPSLNRMAKMTCMSYKTALSALKSLEKLKMIKLEKTNGMQSKIYLLELSGKPIDRTEMRVKKKGSKNIQRLVPMENIHRGCVKYPEVPMENIQTNENELKRIKNDLTGEEKIEDATSLKAVLSEEKISSAPAAGDLPECQRTRPVARRMASEPRQTVNTGKQPGDAPRALKYRGTPYEKNGEVIGCYELYRKLAHKARKPTGGTYSYHVSLLDTIGFAIGKYGYPVVREAMEGMACEIEAGPDYPQPSWLARTIKTAIENNR
jgi:DNA-binding transcriptional regulator YhcF (GntR family)